MTLPRTLCCRVFRIDARETDYVRRGFRGANDSMRHRVERVGTIFTQGYHSALEIPGLDELVEKLERVELEWRGFAYEGAAMGLALLDHLTPWQPSRIAGFLKGAGDRHAYMVHVAVGWVWARLPFFIPRRGRELDPLLRWLAFDGWGFHEGFFHWPDYVAAQSWPRKLRRGKAALPKGRQATRELIRPFGTKGPGVGEPHVETLGYSQESLRDKEADGDYAQRAFDHGLGRSFWFVNGGNTTWIEKTIRNFPEDRQRDLWSGIGLAAVYAGGVDESSLTQLRSAAGDFLPELAQGACFAAKARERAGNMTPYTGIATQMLCGISAIEAARLTDSTLENLPADGSGREPAYEVWRRRIQGRFAGERGGIGTFERGAYLMRET